MKPIDERVDVTYMHALRCVEYRLPLSSSLKRPGFVFSLGLRFGLIGAAASHHLLIEADDQEEREALNLIQNWPCIVEDHVRWSLISRFPFEPSPSLPSLIGRLSYRPLQTYLGLYRRLCPLEYSLSIARDEYFRDHPSAMTEGWSWFRRRSAIETFKQVADESVRYALHFFERREADLEELPEIALIGE